MLSKKKEKKRKKSIIPCNFDNTQTTKSDNTAIIPTNSTQSMVSNMLVMEDEEVKVKVQPSKKKRCSRTNTFKFDKVGICHDPGPYPYPGGYSKKPRPFVTIPSPFSPIYKGFAIHNNHHRIKGKKEITSSSARTQVWKIILDSFKKEWWNDPFPPKNWETREKMHWDIPVALPNYKKAWATETLDNGPKGPLFVFDARPQVESITPLSQCCHIPSPATKYDKNKVPFKRKIIEVSVDVFEKIEGTSSYRCHPWGFEEDFLF